MNAQKSTFNRNLSVILVVLFVLSLPNLLLFVFPILLVAGLFYADWKWLTPLPRPNLEEVP